MSNSLFQVTGHITPCQHIREYPHAVKSENKLLHLAVKEYRPLDNLDRSPGSITFIATHANGFAKETYEPLWDDLYKTLNCKIRALWIADSSHQGASGVLNERLQGDDPSWFDHSRDLLIMINRFWERMPQPIIGIGHSLGAAQLVQLSLIHPRLFHSLVLIEPVIQRNSSTSQNAALPTSYRPDRWDSRSAAEAAFRKNPFFKVWEPRVLEKYLIYGLRETPTLIYPAGISENPTETTPDGVTLTTTKHQEAWSYVRSNFSPQASDPYDHVERLISPDLDPTNEGTYLFHRAEAFLALQGLPQVRPSILWIFGARSTINTPTLQNEKMALSGTGIGGSGGVRLGMVEKKVVDEAGHMVPFEKVQECAGIISRWLEKRIQSFNAEQRFYRDYRSGKSEREMLVMSKDWLKGVRQKSDTKRPTKEKL